MTDNYYPPGADPLRLDALDAAAAAHRAELDDYVVVTAAENAVSSVRLAELTAAYEKAGRRIPAAKARLTRARNSGDAKAIAAAQSHLAAVEATHQQALSIAIREGQQIVAARQDRTDGVLAKIQSSWSASDKAFDARFKGGS